MLKRLQSLDEYMGFVHEISCDPCFRDPMLSTDEQVRCNLLDAPKKPLNQIFGVFEEGTVIGLFVFLILEDEKYMEMLVGLSKHQTAYGEMVSFLKQNFPGYHSDFVYNPNNFLLTSVLRDTGATFEKEQQKMVWKNEIIYQSPHQVELYSNKYKEQYFAIHSRDGYWTADKVIEAPDRFRVLLAIKDGEVVGYTDVTYTYRENEPFDIFVKQEHRKRGYAKAMMAKALELNRPNAMMLLMDIDHTAAIALYESLGFVKVHGENSVVAHILL
ncbi:MAG: GNAT family N-acetyltransferase [Clostridia bacterium]|nr:GNAT family N-acetyltransferase [Clostridia bacterium]